MAEPGRRSSIACCPAAKFTDGQDPAAPDPLQTPGRRKSQASIEVIEFRIFLIKWF
jgi:hypothetical protein